MDRGSFCESCGIPTSPSRGRRGRPMSEPQSRRGFIKTLGASALIAGLGGAPSTVPAKEPAAVGSSNLVPLSRAGRALLDAAAETLIPASDGMPSASNVNVGDHLERLGEREPAVRDSLERALSRLEGFSRALLRSEEHTSELQSPYDLVCRLLLEKKKTEKLPAELLLLHQPPNAPNASVAATDASGTVPTALHERSQSARPQRHWPKSSTGALYAH